MSDESQVVGVTDEQIAEAIEAMYPLHGYAKSDGTKDLHPLVIAIYEAVKVAVVTKKSERASKVITRGTLVATVFPKAPGPDSWSDQDNPELAEKVYRSLAQTVSDLAKPDHKGRVQTRVGMEGLVLCRTTVGVDAVTAWYVTRDLSCILEDFSGPHKKKLRSAADSFAQNLAMVTGRLPEHSRKLGKEYDSGMKAALASGESRLRPALEAATNGGSAVKDENDE